ncbi:hypothetical protein [Demequina pelophila]|uniref:hypothetical protein n=1 Tax=Demequina pelophila TaxID=1638984 RepID=UPI0007821D07|nr:hypothetical protein [Demequina pelophila]
MPALEHAFSRGGAGITYLRQISAARGIPISLSFVGGSLLASSLFSACETLGLRTSEVLAQFDRAA